MRIFWVVFGLGAGLAVWGQQASVTSASALAPKPGDTKWMRGSVMVERWSVNAGKLEMAGNLPSPCHELRLKLPEKPGEAGELAVEAYSVFDPRSICAQMLKPFSLSLPLTAAQAGGKVTLRSE